MLARRVKIRLQKHRTALYIHRIRDGSILVAPSGSSREFSLSTITEPITRAAETLPLPLQYNIPESILNLSEAWVPAGLPTYTTGIVVFAILTRLCLFTPWSYWVCSSPFKCSLTSVLPYSCTCRRGNGNGEFRSRCDRKSSPKWCLDGDRISKRSLTK
jgi:hypothetical protein